MNRSFHAGSWPAAAGDPTGRPYEGGKQMVKFIVTAIVSGLLFGTMDAVINANPLAQKLFSIYKPIARTSVNMPIGIIIDLAYGFILAYLFTLLYTALPGQNEIIKGLSFALIAWFLRVVMYTATQWVMFPLPAAAVVYLLATGLAEMAVLGLLYGLMLKPAA